MIKLSIVCNDISTVKRVLKNIKATNLLICDNEKRSKIMKELESINFNLDYVGPKYLADVILEAEKYNKMKLPSLQNKIYPIIAKKYKVSANNVKNCINYAVNDMYYQCDAEKLKKYFNLIEDEKPSIKRIISTVLNKLN